MALEGGDIGVGVEQLGDVEHLARAGVVVEIVVGEYLHQFNEVGEVEGEFLLGAVDPRFHGVVGTEEGGLIDIGVDDFVGAYQVATAQQKGTYYGEISQFHLLGGYFGGLFGVLEFWSLDNSSLVLETLGGRN